MGSAADGLPPYDKMTRTGFWRQLLARQAFNPPAADADAPPAMLLVISVQASAAPSSEAARAELDLLLGHLLSPGLEPAVRLSLAMQVTEGPGEAVAGGGAELWLHGPHVMEERLHGLSFQVSPAAFFQVSAVMSARSGMGRHARVAWGPPLTSSTLVTHYPPLLARASRQVNTQGAEALCTLLRSLVGATPDTVLLDVCCGTGTLGGRRRDEPFAVDPGERRP